VAANILADGLVSLRRYRDFRSRATRTDLAFFWLLTFVAGGALLLVTRSLEYVLFPAFPLGRIATIGFQLAVLLPWAALGVRRLHDRGLAGWWLLLLVPALIAGLIKQYYLLTDDFDALFAHVQSTPNLAAMVLTLPALVLLCLPGQEEANRYGPNPRYEPAGEAA